MKNELNNQVGMLNDMFLWLVANLKQGVIYFIKQACGNDILASVYVLRTTNIEKFTGVLIKPYCVYTLQQLHTRQSAG